MKLNQNYRSREGPGDEPRSASALLQARHLFDRLTARTRRRRSATCSAPWRWTPHWRSHGPSWRPCIREKRIAIGPGEGGYHHARQAVERALSLEPNLARVMRHCMDPMTHDGTAQRGGIAPKSLVLAPGNAVVLRRAGAVPTSKGSFERQSSLSPDTRTGSVVHSPYNTSDWHSTRRSPNRSREAYRRPGVALVGIQRAPRSRSRCCSGASRGSLARRATRG